MELDDTDEAEKSGKEGSFCELRLYGVLIAHFKTAF
jgi:hypothetical protein